MEATETTGFLPDAKIFTSAWAIKNNSNGTYQARINTIIYEQVEGIHYHESKTTLPVTNNIIIRIVMVLTLIAGCIVNILDVKGLFLHGEFDEGKEKIYISVPEVFEGIFRSHVLLILIKTIYGFKNAAKEFWRDLLRSFDVV